jgi:hypothetical protein
LVELGGADGTLGGQRMRTQDLNNPSGDHRAQTKNNKYFLCANQRSYMLHVGGIKERSLGSEGKKWVQPSLAQYREAPFLARGTHVTRIGRASVPKWQFRNHHQWTGQQPYALSSA